KNSLILVWTKWKLGFLRVLDDDIRRWDSVIWITVRIGRSAQQKSAQKFGCEFIIWHACSKTFRRAARLPPRTKHFSHNVCRCLGVFPFIIGVEVELLGVFVCGKQPQVRNCFSIGEMGLVVGRPLRFSDLVE